MTDPNDRRQRTPEDWAAWWAQFHAKAHVAQAAWMESVRLQRIEFDRIIAAQIAAERAGVLSDAEKVSLLNYVGFSGYLGVDEADYLEGA